MTLKLRRLNLRLSQRTYRYFQTRLFSTTIDSHGRESDWPTNQSTISVVIFHNHVTLSTNFVSNNSYGAVNIPNSTHEFLPRFIIFNRIKTNSCGYLALKWAILCSYTFVWNVSIFYHIIWSLYNIIYMEFISRHCKQVCTRITYSVAL